MVSFTSNQNLHFLPPNALGVSPYQLTGTGGEQEDIPLNLKYNQPVVDSNPYSSMLGGFTEPGSFSQSDLSKDALTFLKQKTGKDIKIQPISNQQFFNYGFGDGLRGFYAGPQQNEPSDQRTIFINQRSPAGLGTLFHESGHAVDSGLQAQSKIQKSFNPEYIQKLNKPEDRLNYLFNTTAWPHVVKETEAQRFAGEALNQFSQQQNKNQRSSFDPKTFTDNPNYKFYPGSYAGQAVSDFFRTELPTPLPLQQQLTPGSDTYFRDATGSVVFGPDNARKALSFGLDKPLWQTQENIMQRTRDYIDPRLNQYMTNPTPAFDNYWSNK